MVKSQRREKQWQQATTMGDDGMSLGSRTCRSMRRGPEWEEGQHNHGRQTQPKQEIRTTGSHPTERARVRVSLLVRVRVRVHPVVCVCASVSGAPTGSRLL